MMLKNFRNLSMGAKLALIIMPVMAAICAGMYLSFLSKIASTEQQAASERVRTISDITAREVGFALRGDDLREIGRAIDSIGRQHNLNYLLVNSDPGTSLGAFREGEARSRDYQAIGPQNELDVAIYKISLPIARKNVPMSSAMPVSSCKTFTRRVMGSDPRLRLRLSSCFLEGPCWCSERSFS